MATHTRTLTHLAAALTLAALPYAPPEARAQDFDSIAEIERTLELFAPLRGGAIRTARLLDGVDAGTCSPDDLKLLAGILAALETVVATEQKLAASASFSFSDNQAEGRSGLDAGALDDEQQRIRTAVSVNRGNYPLEVTLRTGVELTRDENRIEESVSSIFFSVDRNITSARHEAYAFVNRSSDRFLGLTQRYETGGGYVFNHRVGRTAKGRALLRDLRGSSAGADARGGGALPVATAEAASWTACYERLKSVLPSTSGWPTSDALAERLDGSVRIAEKSAAESYYRWRFALLVGFQGEIEQARIEAFDTNDQGYRIVLRPSISWQPFDAVKLRGDWFVMVAPGGFRRPETFAEEIVRDLGLGFLGDDIRTDLRATLAVRVQGVRLSFSHQRLRDSIPPFATDEAGSVAVADDGRPLVAAWKRNQTVFSVEIPL